MGNVQLENALKLAWDAYEAFSDDEAKNFFNIALTVDPDSTSAKVGKGCAVLRPFSLYEADKDSRQACAYWEQASRNADFSDSDRDWISRAALEYLARWKTEIEDIARMTERMDVETTDRDATDRDATDREESAPERNMRELALWLRGVTGIAGMSSHLVYLENAFAALDDMDSVGTELSDLKADLRKYLFFARHPYKATIRKAEGLLPARTDWDGQVHCGFAMFGVEKYECKGKLDIQKSGLKINDVKVTFTAEKDAVRLSIQNESSIRVEDPARIETLLRDACKVWNISSDSKSIQMKIGKEYRDGEVSGALEGIHGEIDGIVREGQKILDIVNENGGKQGLFASIFGKKK